MIERELWPDLNELNIFEMPFEIMHARGLRREIGAHGLVLKKILFRMLISEEKINRALAIRREVFELLVFCFCALILLAHPLHTRTLAIFVTFACCFAIVQTRWKSERCIDGKHARSLTR